MGRPILLKIKLLLPQHLQILLCILQLVVLGTKHRQLQFLRFPDQLLVFQILLIWLAVVKFWRLNISRITFLQLERPFRDSDVSNTLPSYLRGERILAGSVWTHSARFLGRFLYS